MPVLGSDHIFHIESHINTVTHHDPSCFSLELTCKTNACSSKYFTTACTVVPPLSKGAARINKLKALHSDFDLLLHTSFLYIVSEVEVELFDRDRDVSRLDTQDWIGTLASLYQPLSICAF